MDYLTLYDGMFVYSSKGFSVEEALRKVIADENNRKYTPKKAVNKINRALKSYGIKIPRITDPNVVAERKKLREKAEKINEDWASDMLSFSISDVRKKVDLDRTPDNCYKPLGMEGAQEFNDRLCASLDKRKKGEEAKRVAEQMCTEILLEYNHINYNEMFKSRNEAELLDFYSNPKNLWHLRLILEAQNKLEKGLNIELDEDLLKLRENITDRYVGLAVGIQQRLSLMSQKEFVEYDMSVIYKQGLEIGNMEIFPDAEAYKAGSEPPHRINFEGRMLRKADDFVTTGLSNELQDIAKLYNQGRELKFCSFPQGEFFSAEGRDSHVEDKVIEELLAGKPVFFGRNENEATQNLLILDEHKNFVIAKTDYKSDIKKEFFKAPPKKPLCGRILNAIAGIFGGKYKRYTNYLADKAEYDKQQKCIRNIKQNGIIAQDVDRIQDRLFDKEILMNKSKEEALCNKLNMQEFFWKKQQEDFEKGIEEPVELDSADLNKELKLGSGDMRVIQGNSDLEYVDENEHLLSEIGFVEKGIVIGDGNEIVMQKEMQRDDFTKAELDTIHYLEKCVNSVKRDADTLTQNEDFKYYLVANRAYIAYLDLKQYVEEGQEFIDFTEEAEFDMPAKMKNAIGTIAAYRIILQERVANNPNYPNPSEKEVIQKPKVNEELLHNIGVDAFVKSVMNLDTIKEVSINKPEDIVKYFASEVKKQNTSKAVDSARATEAKLKENKAAVKTTDNKAAAKTTENKPSI